MKKNNKKGFTLAELLIVVAIIAVLVAIAIPVFTNQLEKSRESTDAANIRDYYAEIATALVTEDLAYAVQDSEMKVSGGLTAKVTTPLQTSTGTFVITVSGVSSKQAVNEWQSGAKEVAGYTIAANKNMKGMTNIAYTFTVDEKNTYLTDISFS